MRLGTLECRDKGIHQARALSFQPLLKSHLDSKESAMHQHPLKETNGATKIDRNKS